MTSGPVIVDGPTPALKVSAAETPLKRLKRMGQAEEKPKKVVFCTPCLVKPLPGYLKSLEASIPLITAAGWEEGTVYEIGCPYISAARAMMLRKALDAKAEVIVFIDYDLSWEPRDLLRLIETEGDVVAGTYRFKGEPEEYMGALITGETGRPIRRDDGCIKGWFVPAGFLKITRNAVNRFIEAYPELCYGERHAPHVDLFNHGAHEFAWYGEDYAFSRRWREKCGDIWIIPDLKLNHHAWDSIYKGDFDNYLRRRPGGSLDPAKQQDEKEAA